MAIRNHTSEIKLFSSPVSYFSLITYTLYRETKNNLKYGKENKVKKYYNEYNECFLYKLIYRKIYIILYNV